VKVDAPAKKERWTGTVWFYELPVALGKSGALVLVARGTSSDYVKAI
jgi:hypothetical protein